MAAMMKKKRSIETDIAEEIEVEKILCQVYRL